MQLQRDSALMVLATVAQQWLRGFSDAFPADSHLFQSWEDTAQSTQFNIKALRSQNACCMLQAVECVVMFRKR